MAFHLNINAAENYRNAHHFNPLGAANQQQHSAASAAPSQPAGTYITVYYTLSHDTSQSYSLTLRSDLPVDYLKLQLQTKHQFSDPSFDIYDADGQLMPDPLSLSDVPSIQHAIKANEEIRLTVVTADSGAQSVAAVPAVASALPAKSAAEELYELEDDALVDSEDEENDAEEFDEDEDDD